MCASCWVRRVVEPRNLDEQVRPWLRDAFARYAPDLPVVWSFSSSVLPNPARNGDDGAPALISLPILNATVPMAQDPHFHASHVMVLKPGLTATDIDEAVEVVVEALRERRGDPISGSAVVDLPSPRDERS